MATKEEFTLFINQKIENLQVQIAGVESAVEGLFELVKASGMSSAEMDAFMAEIGAKFDALGTDIGKIGEDDPAVPPTP